MMASNLIAPAPAATSFATATATESATDGGGEGAFAELMSGALAAETEAQQKPAAAPLPMAESELEEASPTPSAVELLALTEWLPVLPPPLPIATPLPEASAASAAPGLELPALTTSQAAPQQLLARATQQAASAPVEPSAGGKNLPPGFVPVAAETILPAEQLSAAAAARETENPTAPTTESQRVASAKLAETATNTAHSASPAVPPTAPAERRLASAAEMKLPAAVAAKTEAAVELPTRAVAGTSAAEQGGGMKTERNTNEIAGLAEAMDAELDWVTRLKRSTQLTGGARAIAEGESFLPRMSMAEWMPALGLDTFMARGADGLGESPTPGTASPPATVETLRIEVLRHVAELRLTGASGLDVVLQPDAGTQLTLRLARGADGEVTLRASCAQGDATLLAAHWGEVRQSLAQQGVRVEPLEFASRGGSTFEPQTGNGGPSPDGQPSSQRHGQPWPETLDDLPLVGSITESPTRRGVQRQPGGRTGLLESWA